MHSYVNTRDIHNRFVEQKENKSRVKVEEKKVVIDDMRQKILCKLCPKGKRKWEDVKDKEALKKHKLEAHNLVYCERCFKNVLMMFS